MNSYICHHGIKGMHWGIRRYQNEDGSLTSAGKTRLSKKEYKAMRSDRADNLRKNYKKMVDNNPEVKKTEQEMARLYKKYNFDGDDGGGGITKADQRAGRKYAELMDENWRLRIQLENESRTKSVDDLVKKYGETKVSQMKKRERRNQLLALAAVETVLLAPAAGIIYSGLK